MHKFALTPGLALLPYVLLVVLTCGLPTVAHGKSQQRYIKHAILVLNIVHQWN